MALLTENSSELRNNIIQVLLKKISVLQQQHNAMYEDSPDLFRTINTKGIILNCNRSYARALGYSKNELIGMSIFDHVAEESLNAMTNSFETWKKIGVVRNREVLLKRKDGTKFPVLVSANNLYDENGAIIGSNTVMKDVTEIYEARKELEEKQKIIEDQIDKLQIVDKAKEEFLAMITHELKTPLVPIKGYADILLSEKLGELNNSQKEKLDIIRSSAATLSKLIHDILDAQKLELGQLKMDMQKHNLSDMISDTVMKMKPLAEKYGISIAADIQKDVLCICDKCRIEQVLTNLIANSIDFVPKKTGRIQISLISDNGHAKIIVKDNGIGIKKESIGKIFVKFYQVDTTSIREHGGTGLGLVVCKGIVENHGGKIWAESDGEGKGATIHIKLPTAGKQ